MQNLKEGEPFQFIRQINNILFPHQCAGCGKIGHILCPSCKNHLIPSVPECYVCRRISNGYVTHKECLSIKDPITRAYIGWQYNEIAKILMASYKYKRSFVIGEMLGNLLAERYTQICNPRQIEDIDLVTIVPIDRLRQSQRGFNQCDLIARTFCKQLNLQYSPYLIGRKISFEHQARKSRFERLHNVNNPFFLNTANIQSVSQLKNILIIDDIMTTGATLNSVAKAIKKLSTNCNISTLCLFRGRPRF